MITRRGWVPEVPLTLNRKLIGVCLLFFLQLTVYACSHQVFTSTSDELIKRIDRAAQRHDLVDLREMQGKVTRSRDRRTSAAYMLARYYADPAHEQAAFITNFPTDPMGFGYLYEMAPRVTAQHGTYAFGELAEPAGKGNEVAIRKLLLVDSNADGALAEFVGAQINEIARHIPAPVLKQLAALPRPNATRVANDPLAWCESIRSVKSVRAANDRVRVLQKAISNTRGHC